MGYSNLEEKKHLFLDIFSTNMRDEVTGGWRKLHNEELHNLYPSPQGG
jgi:hypothetical protein